MEFLTSFERVAMRKGERKGKEEVKKEVAQNMLKKGFDMETIIEITGLDKNKIEELMSLSWKSNESAEEIIDNIRKERKNSNRFGSQNDLFD